MRWNRIPAEDCRFSHGRADCRGFSTVQGYLQKKNAIRRDDVFNRGRGTRTPVIGFGDRRSTTELFLFTAAGFRPRMKLYHREILYVKENSSAAAGSRKALSTSVKYVKDVVKMTRQSCFILSLLIIANDYHICYIFNNPKREP